MPLSSRERLLFAEDFHRAERYPALSPIVTTADWRGVVGWLRARTAPAAVVVELASARALDVVRAVIGDASLGAHRLVGVALDPEIAGTARRLGLTVLVSADEAERDGGAALVALLESTGGIP